MTWRKQNQSLSPPTARNPYLQYTTSVLDRQTGDLVTADLGDWKTVTEVGEIYGVGPRQVRLILHHMGVLQLERQRYRLPYSFVARGMGKRIERPKSGQSFDVLSPKCQALIASAWADTVADYEADLATASGIPEAADALVDYDADRLHPLDATGKILWLLDHFRALTLTAIAEVVGVDLGLVSRVAKERGRQRKTAKERKDARSESAQFRQGGTTAEFAAKR